MLAHEILDKLQITNYFPSKGRFISPTGGHTVSEIMVEIGKLTGKLPEDGIAGELISLLEERKKLASEKRQAERDREREERRIRNEQLREERKEAERKKKIEEKLKRKLEVRDQFGLQETEADHNISNMINNAIPVMDLESGEVVFYNKDERIVESISREAYEAHNIKGIKGKQIDEESILGIFVFDPQQKEFKVQVQRDGRILTAFNLCKPAPWLNYEPSENPQMSDNIRTLFKSVFAREDEREYVYDWIYNAITRRNETILCMIGSQGVGKDFLATLIGHGVGPSFMEKADSSILAEKFNSQMSKKRLLFLDEVTVDTEDKSNRLKTFTNSRIQYEAKGRDAITISNYASVILANNNMNAVIMSNEDRRFSAPEIGTRPLKAVFMKELGLTGTEADKRIASFREMLDSEEPSQEIVDFYNWLIEHVESKPFRNPPSNALKGDYFFKICDGIMPNWERTLYQYCRDHYHLEKVYINDIKKQLPPDEQKTFPRSNKISQRLFKYREAGYYSVGTLHDQTTRNPYIELAEEFIGYMEELTGELAADRKNRYEQEYLGLTDEAEEAPEIVDESETSGEDLL